MQSLYCGYEDAIEVFDFQRPGEGRKLATTPSKKSRDGMKGSAPFLSVTSSLCLPHCYLFFTISSFFIPSLSLSIVSPSLIYYSHIFPFHFSQISHFPILPIPSSPFHNFSLFSSLSLHLLYFFSSLFVPESTFHERHVKLAPALHHAQLFSPLSN